MFLMNTNTNLSGLCGSTWSPMVKENDSISLNCTAQMAKKSSWKLENKEISTCFNSSSSCNVTNKDVFTASLNNEIHYLTINDAQRDFKTFTFFSDDVKVEACSCDLCVTSKPAKPTCQMPTLDKRNTSLNIVCETSSVYPDAVCSLSHFKTGVAFHGNVWTVTNRSGGELANVSVKCFISIDLQDLSPSEESFRVSFSPTCNLNDGTFNKDLTSDSDFSPLITLKLPTVSPLNCTDSEYTPIGSMATCRCELSDVGNPPGSVNWYTDYGREVGIPDGRSSILKVSFNASDRTPRFYCRPVSILNTTSDKSQIMFQPKFYCPPQSPPVFTVTNADIVDTKVLVTRDVNVKVSCRVGDVVTSVTLECATQMMTAVGQYASWTVKVNESIDGLSCRCTAKDELGCYHQAAELTFTLIKDVKDLTLQWLAVGLGTAGGLILIIIVSAFIIRRLIKKPAQQKDKTKTQNQYDNIYNEESIYSQIYDSK
ncbi:hypothetical protein BgiBS90_026462 [Biomphalaria glabrata]|nr:hypothetical protein BgiBS90_026462 [Biomphalaria glabrata]